MTTTRRVTKALMLAHQCENIRADACHADAGTKTRYSDGSFHSWKVEYGNVMMVTATGRATCRCCGQKIVKGEQALRFAWDFNGCGSFTAQTIQIHRAACVLVEVRP